VKIHLISNAKPERYYQSPHIEGAIRDGTFSRCTLIAEGHITVDVSQVTCRRCLDAASLLTVYCVTYEACYRHDILGVYARYQGALAGAILAIQAEPDDHHSLRIHQLILEVSELRDVAGEDQHKVAEVRRVGPQRVYIEECAA